MKTRRRWSISTAATMGPSATARRMTIVT